MSDFTDSIQRHLGDIQEVSPGICYFCPDCRSQFGYSGRTEEELREDIENQEVIDEGGFSRQDCDSCGSSLGGDRYCAHGWWKQSDEERDFDLLDVDSVIHLDICTDCLMYFANGQEPGE